MITKLIKRKRKLLPLTEPLHKYLESRSVRLDSTCIEWTKSKDIDGYGYACLNNVRTKAHRLSYHLYYSVPFEDMEGLHVCHKCDNPSCINPKHLYLATALDNKHDMIRKKRDARGHRHGNAKLTAEQIKFIRENFSFLLDNPKNRPKRKVSFSSVAKDYGVTPRVIALILKGETYEY